MLTTALVTAVVVGAGAAAWQYRTTSAALASEEAANYANRIRLAASFLREGQPDLSDEQLDGCPVSRRGWEWHFLRRISRPPVVTLRGHSEAVLAVRYSPDGRVVATGGRDGTVRLWDAATGAELRVLRGHSGWVKMVSFRGDGRVLASAEQDGTVIVWDAAAGRELQRFPSAGEMVEFAPAGPRLATAGLSGQVTLWDGDTGRAVWGVPVATKRIYGLAFDRAGGRLAVSSRAPAVVTILGPATGRELYRMDFEGRGLDPGSRNLSRVGFTPNGDRLLVAADARIWEIDPATSARREVHVVINTTCGLAMSPVGRQFAASNIHGHVRQFDLVANRSLYAPRSELAIVPDLAYSPDGRTLAVPRGSVVTLEPCQGRPPLASRALPGRDPDTRWNQSLTFSADGRRLATVSRQRLAGREWLLCWDMASGRLVHAINQDTTNQCTGRVFFLPDGRCVYSRFHRSDPKGPAISQLRDLGSGRDVWTQPATTTFNPIHEESVIASPDGRFLAWCDGASRIELRDATTLQSLRVLEGPIDMVSFDVTRDGRCLAVAAYDESITVWDTESGRVELSIRMDLAGSDKLAYAILEWVRFSPDGRRLAAAVGSGVRIYDAMTGKPLLHLTGHQDGAAEVEFSPDGRRLASVGIDSTVRIWDTERGLELLTLTDPAGPLKGICFSPDGNLLAATCADGSVKIYDGTPLPEGEP